MCVNVNSRGISSCVHTERSDLAGFQLFPGYGTLTAQRVGGMVLTACCLGRLGLSAGGGYGLEVGYHTPQNLSAESPTGMYVRATYTQKVRTEKGQSRRKRKKRWAEPRAFAPMHVRLLLACALVLERAGCSKRTAGAAPAKVVAAARRGDDAAVLAWLDGGREGGLMRRMRTMTRSTRANSPC